MSGTVADQDDQAAHPRKAGTALLLGALGIVYGDIGTSPIYPLRESFKAAPVDPRHVAGFALRAPGRAFVTLGSVFLAVTGAGAEALHQRRPPLPDPARARDRAGHPGRALSGTFLSGTLA